MMRLRSFILFSFIPIFFFTAALKSQDTNIVSYYPASTGNVWVYHVSSAGLWSWCTVYAKKTITGTCSKFGKSYYVFRTTSRFISGSDSCIVTGYDTTKIDSVSGNILRFVENGTCYNIHESIIDSLRSRINDTLKPCGFRGQICYDTSSIILFGLNRQRKSFCIPSPQGSTSWYYIQGLGYSYYRSTGTYASITWSLRGCVINGVVLGDTNIIIGIKELYSPVPESFNLFQNYPNPFNPVTKIRFALPPSPSGEGLGVRLIVYDILGREVQTLVNEQLSPGTYEVDWDGTNYPSGVYYYRLAVSDPSLRSGFIFKETRRMVLVK